MIAARGLSRSFEGRVAVDAVSFEVPQGRLCALLGPNGAGKTTTVRMLLGLLPPTSGTAEVAGVRLPAPRDHARSLRARAGLLTETPGFYDRLTGVENLDFFARLYGLPDRVRGSRIESWLKRLDLWDARDRPFGGYSKGMKQRLALIRAVFHEPAVIFLDEPTAGLDPAAAREVRDLVADLRGEGRTILLCTHHLGEAQSLADLVGILQGRLLAFGSLEALTGNAGVVEIRLDRDAAPFLPPLQGIPGVGQVQSTGPMLRVATGDSDGVTPRVVASLVSSGAGVLEVRPVRVSLEEVYLRAVGAEA